MAIGIFLSAAVFAQQNAGIAAKEKNHDFGVIKEEKGKVEHVFIIENTGNAPLVIDRITSSCGCTLPEWSKEPVSPGKTKEVRVWYDPYGRPGAFYKTISVYSNAEPRRFVLSIRGEVLRKQNTSPEISYPYTIGELKLLSKSVTFNTIRPKDTLGEKILVKNGGDQTVSIRFDDVPEAITVEARPQTLQPHETGELIFLFNAAKVGKKGRYTASLPIRVQPLGASPVTQTIELAANVIDDFGKLTAADKEKAPIALFSATLIDFGKVEAKNSILGLGGKVTQTLEITNKGKSTLSIYSIGSEDERIDVGGGKKEIKPNSSATFKITIRPKDIKIKMETTITIVCNDPAGPVRLIKVIAEK